MFSSKGPLRLEVGSLMRKVVRVLPRGAFGAAEKRMGKLAGLRVARLLFKVTPFGR